MKDFPKTKLDKTVEVIDLFCGAGGLSFGLKKANIDIKAGIDLDAACAYPFTANNKSKFIHKNISDISGCELTQLYSPNAIKMLAGCAPCQPFSSYSQGSRGKRDTQWSLLDEFLRLISETGPDIVSMENVPALSKHPIFDKFVSALKTGSGMPYKYYVEYKLVACDTFGLPQKRKRLVLLASRYSAIKLNIPQKNPVSVMTKIGKLPHLSAGEIDPKDSLHRTCGLTPINLARIKSSRPGGTWRDWDNNLIAKCHKKVSGMSYPSVYGRMEWTKPAPTITTQFFGFGNGRFGHPVQNRALSLREGAMLQSFPKNYKFLKPGTPVHFAHLGRLIGNAVPPMLGKIIGDSVQEHLRTEIKS